MVDKNGNPEGLSDVMSEESKMYRNNKTIYEAAIDKWGAGLQLDMVIEEMSELMKEIIKLKRGKNNFANIIEESADVRIMLDQLEVILERILEDEPHEKEKLLVNSVRQAIDCSIEFKINRLRDMLKN